jgi:hypothetical protein
MRRGVTKFIKVWLARPLAEGHMTYEDTHHVVCVDSQFNWFNTTRATNGLTGHRSSSTSPWIQPFGPIVYHVKLCPRSRSSSILEGDTLEDTPLCLPPYKPNGFFLISQLACTETLRVTSPISLMSPGLHHQMMRCLTKLPASLSSLR